MAEAKTKATTASVEDFLAGVENPDRRADCLALLPLFRRIVGEAPKMWGPSIVGFGIYRYRYASGHEGEWPITGFSPRKQDLTLYIMAGFDRFEEIMARLGKHKTGKSCLYLKRLSDVDLGALEELVAASVAHVRKTYA